MSKTHERPYLTSGRLSKLIQAILQDIERLRISWDRRRTLEQLYSLIRLVPLPSLPELPLPLVQRRPRWLRRLLHLLPELRLPQLLLQALAVLGKEGSIPARSDRR